MQSRLNKQLGPEYISTRPGGGGGRVPYLAAEKAINLANEVFGFNGWSSEIKQIQIDFVDETSSGKITMGLSVISRVTLKDGTFHEDIGYGHIENCKGKAAAFEKAKKEAATDAMKRALRNFGNVLGNCLYDKDYLARVTKVKIAPSKWDADNLHRHPDYAPIKKESIADVSTASIPRAAVTVPPPPPARLQSSVTVQSNGTDNEDDYGGNLFDEVDFTHPDEVSLDDTPMRPISNGPGLGAIRNPINRVASMPAIRGQGAMQNAQPSNVQQQSRPPGPPNNNPTNANALNNQGVSRMMPPPNQGQRFPQQQNGPQSSGLRNGMQQNGAQQNQFETRSNTSSGSSTNQQTRPADRVDKLTPPEEQNPTPPQQLMTPQNVPVGFVSGKAASALTEASGGDPSALRPFDIHHESPSIRRTQGVDPRKSAPVRRSDIGAAPPAVLSQSAPGAPSGPIGRPNFINPGADPNRRIGAPGSMQSPMANRNAYKPPSMLKRPAPTDNAAGRPPLTDVSNMPQSAEGGNDPKKLKVEPNGQQAQQEANATVS